MEGNKCAGIFSGDDIAASCSGVVYSRSRLLRFFPPNPTATLILICCWLTACCHLTPRSSTLAPQEPTKPATQEVLLTKHPAPDLTNYNLHLAWVRVSQKGKRYRLTRPQEFKIAGSRSFQCGTLNECFMIVSDQRVKVGSRYKILVLYASDNRRMNYEPHWVKCNHDLSRTSLYNSNIGVVAVEYLEGGGQEVSSLKWDEGNKAFVCVKVQSPSLVYPQ